MKTLPSQPVLSALAAILAVLAVCGCALDRLPRIDPSGERLFVFPDSQPVIGPVAGSTIPGGAGAIAPPPGNLTAPPVLPAGGTASPNSLCPLCPLCPICPLGGLLDGPKKIVGPLAPAPPESPTERVTLSPGRVLAPVGSEVVLRAGVCGRDGYLLTNRKIEWMLSQQGTGQFAEIGEEGERDFLRYPWSTPKKVDNHYAVGYTSPFYTCLRRGTATPTDDLQIQSGEAWVTVTSPTEGTSYVTAYAPDGENWNTRRAQATIYWVDAQWQLPPSAFVAAGQPHTLTTTVTRQTDGAPLAGWIVRYEVTDGSGAQLGYDAGQTFEETTDNRGQASVQVTPTDSNPGSSRVRVTVVRPEQAGVASSPRLDVGSGESVITWSNTAPGTQPLFPPVQPQPTPPFQPTPPTTPTPTPTPGESPIGVNEPTGRPILNLRVQQITQGEIKVGQQVEYLISLENMGDGVARNVKLVDKFDDGLGNINASPGEFFVSQVLGNLGPGDKRDAPVAFRVNTPGQHWHDVTVTADGQSPEFVRSEFQAVNNQPVLPTLILQTDLPVVRPQAGGLEDMKVVIQNTGQTAADGVLLTVAPDAAKFRIEGVTRLYEQQTQTRDDGSVVTNLGRIEAGQKIAYSYRVRFLEATETARKAVIAIRLQSPQGVNEYDSKEVEIAPKATPLPGSSPLSITISSTANPLSVSAGRTANLIVTLKNNSQQPLRNVQLQVNVPQQVLPKTDTASTPTGTALRVALPIMSLTPAITEIPAGQEVRLVVPYDAQQQGNAVFGARAIWQGVQRWQEQQATVTIQP